MIYIGAEHILSSLGSSASDNFREALKGNSGLKVNHDKISGGNKPLGILNNFELIKGYSKVESMCISSASACLSGIDNRSFSDKWLVILSTTKGDIDHLVKGDIDKAKPTYLAKRVAEKLPITSDVMLVSNACISGLLAIITANDLVLTGKYEHVLVIGVDVVSSFTTNGFESFYALSKNPSAPFDKNRTGLSLGEAASSVIVSSSKEIYKESPMIISGGASANDANHISGPSRDGEGLVRAINSTLKIASVKSEEIDFISAHGTGTRFNDDMESIAFTRCNLNKVPINSMKGYFGHTLGAAGVLELSMSIQSMRNGQMIKTLGCSTPGTSEEINVLMENDKAELKTVLKTASGFGGCNAAIIIKMDQGS